MTKLVLLLGLCLLATTVTAFWGELDIILSYTHTIPLLSKYTKDTVMLQVTWTRTRTASATPWMTMMTMTAFLTTVSVTAGGV